MLIVLFILFVAGACIYVFKTQSNYTSKQLPVKQFNESAISENDIADYISSNHEYWNEEICWERYKDFTFNNFKSNYNDYMDTLITVSSTIDNPDLKADFQHLQQLLESAKKTSDVQYLIEVHRIFHDLDVAYNDYVSKDYFRVTQYGNSKK